METAPLLPPEVRADPISLTFTMAIKVIRHFFGKLWCEEHIIQDAAHSRPDGFLRINYTPGFAGERKRARVPDFAETLFNLQTSRASTIALTRCGPAQSRRRFAGRSFRRDVRDVVRRHFRAAGARC
jgi:hypothetical protein